MTELNYQALNSLIENRVWWFTPAELHGILTALTAFKRPADWPAMLALGNDEAADAAIPDIQQHIEASLEEADLSYRALLDDSGQLDARAESLSMWAEGFSLTAAYLREAGHLPELDDASIDFLSDLAEIAKLDSALPDTEENQRLLTDLEEHARMGSLMLYAAVRGKKAP